MIKRLVDVVLAASALLLLTPVLAIAALGIRLSSPGPILYRARRVGRDGRIFCMYKFRTMQVNHGTFTSRITAQNDPRIFTLGVWLRGLKIDELPQLINVLRGEMSLVGPRPEDPRIVEDYYAQIHLETLQAQPGLTSPGSIYDYTHGERLLDKSDTERCYVERLLPVKLALDTIYLRRSSLAYDVRIILRTVWVIVVSALGVRFFPDPPEMEEARGIILPTKQPGNTPIVPISSIQSPERR